MQADSPNQFHHQKVDRSGCSYAVCLNDIRVVQLHAGRRFQLHASQHAGIERMVGREYFQGHFLVFNRILRDENTAHSAEAKHLSHAVAVDYKAAISAFQQSFGLKRGQQPFTNQSSGGLFGRGIFRDLQFPGDALSRAAFTSPLFCSSSKKS